MRNARKKTRDPKQNTLCVVLGRGGECLPETEPAKKFIPHFPGDVPLALKSTNKSEAKPQEQQQIILENPVCLSLLLGLSRQAELLTPFPPSLSFPIFTFSRFAFVSITEAPDAKPSGCSAKRPALLPASLSPLRPSAPGDPCCPRSDFSCQASSEMSLLLMQKELLAARTAPPSEQVITVNTEAHGPFVCSGSCLAVSSGSRAPR